MKMRKHHCARLKHAKGQIFTCGMFGTCSDSVLSPRTPPPALVISNPVPTNAVAPAPSPVKINQQNIQNQMSPCSIPSPDTVSQEKLISQWDFGLKQQQQQNLEKNLEKQQQNIPDHQDEEQEQAAPAVLHDPERFKERYVGLVDRDLSPLQQQLLNGSNRPFHSPPPLALKDDEMAVDLSNVDALCREIAAQRFSKMILRSLRHQADEDDEKKSKIVASGATEHLIKILAEIPIPAPVPGSNPREAAIRREALALLSVLADDERTQKAMAESRENILPILQRELDRRSADAWVLLCKASTNEELVNGDIHCTGVLDSCVSLLKDPSAEAKLVRLALKAMLGICLSRENRSAAVRAGAVDALLATLVDLHGVDGGEFCNRSGIVVNVERALATLELLCTTTEGRAATVSQPGCISELVGLVLGVSERATEYAAGVLCAVLCDDPAAAAAIAAASSRRTTVVEHGNTTVASLANHGNTTTIVDHGDSVQEIAVKGGAPAQMLLVMQSECSERARRKAAKLLKALHKYGEDHTSTIHSDLASTITY